jgi:hypothetical protein
LGLVSLTAFLELKRKKNTFIVSYVASTDTTNDGLITARWKQISSSTSVAVTEYHILGNLWRKTVNVAHNSFQRHLANKRHFSSHPKLFSSNCGLNPTAFTKAEACSIH